MSDNLIPVRTEAEAREKGRNGGIKSGEARRAKKTMKEMLDYLLEKDITTKKGDISTLEAIMVSMIAKASKGDVRAAEFIRDTIGQKPDSTLNLDIKQALVRFIDAGSDS
jgi:hypothetical protein